MPDFTETQFPNPLMGKVFDSHPKARTASRSRCFERGYHRGPDAEGLCLDCAGRAGLPFRTEAEIPSTKPVFTDRPPVVAHNEHASFEELMAERGLTPEEHKAAQGERAKVLAGVEPEPVALSREHATKVGEAYLRVMKTPENVKKWCAELSIPLVAEGGVYLHLEAKLASALRLADELADQLKAMSAALGEKSREIDTLTEQLAAMAVQSTPGDPAAANPAAPVHADHEGGL